MNAIKRVLRFEFSKLKRNKAFWIVLAAVLLITIAGITIFYFNFTNVSPAPPRDREAILNSYRQDVEVIDSMLESDNSLSAERRDELNEWRGLLMLYISTQTIESDYLKEELIDARPAGMENSAFMLHFTMSSAFVLWVIAIIAAAYLFIFEHHAHLYKNFFVGQVGRKQVFLGKLILLLATVTAVQLLFAFYALLFGLTDPNVQMIAMLFGKYTAISALTACAAQVTAVYTLTLLLISITLFVGMLLKNAIVASATSTAIYASSALMYRLFGNIAYTDPKFSSVYSFKYMPVFSLQLHVGAFDAAFLVALILHLAAAVALTLFAARKFTTQDI